MKNTVLKVAFTLILAVGFILPGCNKDGENCSGCETIKRYFDMNGLNISFNDIDNSTNSYQWRNLKGIFNYEATYYGDLNMEKQKSYFTGFSLMSSALACSCEENGYEGSEEGIVSLTFKTVKDYNANYLAGSDVSEIIKINSNLLNYVSVAAFIEENEMNIKEQYDTEFRLEEAPSAAGLFQLEIELTLNNGEVHSALTEEISLRL